MRVVLSRSKWGYHLDLYSRITYLCLSAKEYHNQLQRTFRKKGTFIDQASLYLSCKLISGTNKYTH